MSGLTWAHTTRTRDARGGKTLHSATPIAQLASAAGPQRGSHGGCAHPQPRQAATRRRYIRRTTDQGPRQETASDVGDRHLDERELELQPLAGRHEELGAAILGGDLHAWLGLGLRSGLGLGISTPARCGGDTGGAEAAQRRRRGGAEAAQRCTAVWCSCVVQRRRAAGLGCGSPEPSSRALQAGPAAALLQMAGGTPLEHAAPPLSP